MIKILDASLNRQATLKRAINPIRFEEINGQNTLNFGTILDQKTSTYLNEDSVIELDNDYFDIVYIKKDQNEDGTLTVDTETEHVSYRLNDPLYNKEWFTEMGTPEYILGKILEGTDFTVGVIEFTEVLTYSAQEKKSRRQLLMEFVTLLGGELDFIKFEISIVQHRGNTDLKPLAKGKNIKVVSKIFNKRETDSFGNPLVAYTCEPIQIPDKEIGLGDDVLLIQKDLDIREQLRIVSYSYNPYDKREASIELANFISGLEDDIYRIETTTLAKEKVYNGIRIGPDNGFEAERSDKKAKTVMNATEGIKILKGDGSGSYSDEQLFADTEGNLYIANALEANKIYAENIDTTNALISTAQIETLEVGSNVIMGPNTTISWSNVSGTPDIPDGTYIDANGIYTGDVYADQIVGEDFIALDTIRIGSPDYGGARWLEMRNSDGNLAFFGINSVGNTQLSADNGLTIVSGDSLSISAGIGNDISISSDLDLNGKQLINAYGEYGFIAESRSGQKVALQVTGIGPYYLEVFEDGVYKGDIALT